jgi:hypothetical protein
MAEIGVGALLALTGSALLAPVKGDVTPMARVWLSIPMGAALYTVVALFLIVLTGTLSPGVAFGWSVLLGLAVAVVTSILKGFDWADLRWAAIALGLAVVTVALARVVHLTRLTPDSLRYLLASTDVVRPDALEEMNKADLIIRQLGLPSLHALSELGDRRYLASLAPLFGVFGLGLSVWLIWAHTTSLEPRRRRWLVASSILFLVTANRLVYDAFYINTHIHMAVYLLIAVAGCWLAASTGRWGWAWPAGLSMAAMLLLRPEAPLVVAIVLVTLAASRASWAGRAAATVPSVIVMAVWYGIALWQHANYGDLISLTTPVFGSLVAVFGSAMIVVIGGLHMARPVTSRLDLIALVGLAVVLVAFAIRQPDVLVTSVQATARNVVYDGLWLTTWVALLVLLVIALLVERIPDGRLWTVPIIGFGLLFWLLPLLREGAYRVGSGDSGNRMLAHFLGVAVVFLALAAVDRDAADRRVDSV